MDAILHLTKNQIEIVLFTCKSLDQTGENQSNFNETRRVVLEASVNSIITEISIKNVLSVQIHVQTGSNRPREFG